MTTVTTPLKKEQDWADISDDDEEEQAPTVKVDADTDSLDLNSLSLADNAKQDVKPEKSLADRISLGDETPTNHQEPRESECHSNSHDGDSIVGYRRQGKGSEGAGNKSHPKQV